ncbi:MAG: tetratricopeptide repeat protein [Thermodesulfobacteriota bacterium]
MNKSLRFIIVSFSVFLMIGMLSCAAMERGYSPSLVDDFSEKIVHQDDDAIQAAYQNYAFACIAILHGDYEQGEIHLKEALKHDEDPLYLLIKLSHVLLKQGKEEEALDFAQAAIEAYPDNMNAKELAAGIYTRLNRFKLAISHYQEIVKDHPEHQDARLKLATLFIRLKDYDSASKHLLFLIEENPELLIVHYYMGRINLEENRYSRAEKAFRRVLEINPEFLPGLFDLAVVYGKTEKLDQAIACYEKILAISPSNTSARERVISLYYETGQKHAAEEAIGEMEKSIRPGERERKKLGFIYLKYGKVEQSIAELTSVVSAFPEDQEARYYLAAALEEHGDFDAAYEHLSLLGAESNYFIHARIRMAYILQDQGNIDEAIVLLRDTIDLKERSPRLYLVLSTLYESKKQFHSALNVLNEGLENDTTDTNLLYRIGIVLDKLDRDKECLEHMEKILAIDPTHADALNYIGYTYADKGIHLDKAQEMIEKALKYKPESGYILDSLGWVYFRKGLYDKALIKLNRAVELTPDDPVINEHLGDVYLKKEHYERALESYEKALSLDHEDKERLKEKIKEISEHLNGEAQ